MLLSNKWFTKSTDEVTSVSAPGRFADRLNSVWFKYNKSRNLGGFIVGSVRLGQFLTELHERVLKLEEYKDQLQRPLVPSSVGRTALGTYTTGEPQTAISSDEGFLLQVVRRFKTNNSSMSFVYQNGLKITIERDPDGDPYVD